MKTITYGWAVPVVALLALALGGSALATSNAAPTNTTPPKITGTPTVGQALTTDNGTFTNAPTSYAYQWRRCNTAGASCVAVANGTQKTYTLVGADRGHTMRVRVTATNADGSATAESDPTTVVTGPTSTAAPRNTTRPTINGNTTVGETLSADHGTWTGTPTSYSYQWQRCDFDVATCTIVTGATGSTYNVSSSDVGYRLRVNVTAKNAAGSANANSLPTDVVAPKVVPTNGRPTLAILSVRFVGATVYARFRICDDGRKNLTIIETDSRPGKASLTRRFSTLAAPNPCGVYTRHWLPASRFRGTGRFTVTLSARDTSGSTSAASHRTFTRG